ncbi:MAG: type II toxin-antitoxin system VapC family toxin [Gemmatimonadales bacterium]|nr:type II toxin-antitoxin system VapC family toxin [Gemmatimonadales bacterium]
MSERYVLDTSVYVGAWRNEDERRALAAFVRRHASRLLLSAVVLLELRAGARTDDAALALEEFESAFGGRGGIVVPGASAYREAGRALADLAVRERLAAGAIPAALVNDALLAASCREQRATLLTRNGADFARLARELRGFRWRVADVVARGAAAPVG